MTKFMTPFDFAAMNIAAGLAISKAMVSSASGQGPLLPSTYAMFAVDAAAAEGRRCLQGTKHPKMLEELNGLFPH